MNRAFAKNVVALLGLLALPALAYYLWACAAYHRGAFVVPTFENLSPFPFPTPPTIVILAGWLTFQAILYSTLPGKSHHGPPLSDGSRLNYRMNGLASFAITVVLFAWVTAGTTGENGPFWVIEFIVICFGELLITANIFCFLFAIWLYLRGKRQEPDVHPRNAIYDFFVGTQLNPRIKNFDLKFFFESRPGLMGWAIINIALAFEQYNRYGFISTPMWLVVSFQFWYVADYFLHEPAILSTWDIKEEKFGWMLLWGDLVWVPFVYTLQAHYLLSHPHDLPWWGVAGIVLLNVGGYIIFRGANWQKHTFRTNPDRPIWGKRPIAIVTARGTRLLASGWWGLSRHMNYLGDLMMALAWCLPCLFESGLPYFYFVFFLVLLVHRERRDNQACAEKYGDDWQAYCRRVRWRIVPYVY